MRLLIYVTLITFVVMISGCGSNDKPKISPEIPDDEYQGSGGNGLPDSGGSNISVSGNISGVQVIGGSIVLYDYSERAQPSRVASKSLGFGGTFSLSGQFRTPAPIALICLENAIYREPASLSQISMLESDSLCSFQKLTTGQNSISLNPLMNIHYELTLNGVKNGLSLDNAINSSKSIMNRAYGFSTDGYISPLDISGAQIGNIENSSLLIFSISNYMLEMSKSAGNSSHTYNYSLLAFIKAASRDAQDGMLDGKGFSSGGSIVSVGIGSREFNGKSYTSDLAQSLVKYIAGENNTTGLDINTIIESQKSLASNKDVLFGADISILNADGLDAELPVLALDIENGISIYQDQFVGVAATDNIAVSRIEVRINNGETQVFIGASASVPLVVSSLLSGSNQLEVTAYDIVGNNQTKTVSFNLITDSPDVSVLSDTLTAVNPYLFELQIIENTDQVVSVSINNQSVPYSGSASSLLLDLDEGDNEIVVALQTSDFTFDYQFQVTLDTTIPSVITHLDDQHTTFYKAGSRTSVEGTLRFDSSVTTFYIFEDRSSLNGLALTYNNFKMENFPVIRFSASDSESNEQDLLINYRYRHDNSEVLQGALGLNEKDDGFYLIPLAEEYLGDGWAEFDGVHYIDLIVIDEAGNTNTTTYDFKTYYASPRAETNYAGVDGVLSENSDKVYLELIDIQTADDVVFTIGGQTYTMPFSYYPVFDLDVSTLTHGVNTGTLVVNKNGSNIISQQVSVTVDKTPPLVYSDADSKKSSNQFTVGGLINDDYSQVSSIEMEVKKYYVLNSNVEFYSNFETILQTPTYNQFNGNFESDFNLGDGVYRIKTNATATNDLVGEDYSVVEVDTTPPAINPRYPQFPYDVYSTEFVQVQPVLVDFDLSYDFITTYYMPQSKTTMQGIPLTIQSLMDNKMLFIYVIVEDITLSTGGAGTVDGDLEVTYSYRIGSEQIFTRRPIDVSSTGDVLLPITVEYFTDELINKGTYDSDDRFPIHKIDLFVRDEMGNEASRTYGLRTLNDPDNTYDL